MSDKKSRIHAFVAISGINPGPHAFSATVCVPGENPRTIPARPCRSWAPMTTWEAYAYGALCIVRSAAKNHPSLATIVWTRMKGLASRPTERRNPSDDRQRLYVETGDGGNCIWMPDDFPLDDHMLSACAEAEAGFNSWVLSQGIPRAELVTRYRASIHSAQSLNPFSGALL